MREVEAFFKRLQGQVHRREDEDVMTWRASKKGLFTVKSFYSSLVLCNTRLFPSAIVWNLQVPKRVSFVAWEVVWRRILNLDGMQLLCAYLDLMEGEKMKSL